MKIFVYGTLKRDFYNHRALHLWDERVAKFLGEATIKGYVMFNLGYYPYITHGNGIVKGEVFEIHDDNILTAINAMERGAGYISEMVDVRFSDGKSDKALVYIFEKVSPMHTNEYEEIKDKNMIFHYAGTDEGVIMEDVAIHR